MTLLFVRQQILDHFLAGFDTFSKDDFANVRVADSLMEQRDNLTTAALQELTELGLVRSVGDGIWILGVPLDVWRQDLSLDLGLSARVAGTINTFYSAMNLNEDAVDPLRISDQHVETLLDIIDDLVSTDDGGTPPVADDDQPPNAPNHDDDDVDERPA